MTIRHTALALVAALLINAGGLLLCQWECASGAATRSTPHSACHQTQDEGAVLQAAAAHDCVATSTAPVTTAAKHLERATPRAVLSSFHTFTTDLAVRGSASIPSPPGATPAARSALTVVLRI